jgi:hypothetical protein
MIYEQHSSLTGRTPRIRTLIVLVLALWGLLTTLRAAGSQELGRRLYDSGLRQTVALKDGTGAQITGTFHPEIPMAGDFFLTRYGLPLRPLGTLRGPEGTSPQDLTELAAAGLLAGLPRTFVATTTDWVDARMLRYAGQSWWGAVVDPLLAQLHREEPPAGPPSPPCALPSVCMVPPPPCSLCPPVLECPPVAPCPACAAQPTLVAVPADVLETLRVAAGWINPVRPQQRRRLQAVYEWLAKVEAVKGKP